MNRYENLEIIGYLQDKNGNEYALATQNGYIYLISTTISYKNILYSRTFNADYENNCEDLNNLDKYSFRIVHQELR